MPEKMKQIKLQQFKHLSNSRNLAKKKKILTLFNVDLKKQEKDTSFHDENDFQVIKLTISY